MTDQVRIETLVRVTTADGQSTTMVAGTDTPPAVVDQPSIEDLPELSYADAAELTARIRQSLDHVEELIARAYVGRAWKALGYASWDAWVDEKFGDRPLLAVARQDRQEVVLALSGAGMSSRAIARALGIGKGTVGRELASAPDGALAAETTGRNGKSYGPRPPKPDEGQRVCEHCGGDHLEPSDECPILLGGFAPIALSPDDLDIDPATVFGPGTRDAETDDVDGCDVCGQDVEDCECDDVEPRPEDAAPVPHPPADVVPPAELARRRVRRLRSAVERIVVVRDDLDELPGLLESMGVDLTEWPTREVAPEDTLAGDLIAAVEAIEQWQARLPRMLADARTVIARLGQAGR